MRAADPPLMLVDTPDARRTAADLTSPEVVAIPRVAAMLHARGGVASEATILHELRAAPMLGDVAGDDAWCLALLRNARTLGWLSDGAGLRLTPAARARIATGE